ncbi:MAG: MATE family efflux transporter, partial [Planctomycetes bacterium]|nr:MATE family efflux transporter [Planctomycetota bacterium]
SIGRGTGVLYCLWSLWRGRGRLCLRDQPLRIDPSVMLRLVRVSLGGIGQMLIATASWMVLMWIVARFGKAAVAGYTVAIRLLMFTILPAWGLSNAAATLTGQNLGAGNPERAERAVWLTGLYNMVFMVLVTAFCVFFGETMLRPFELTPSVEPFARDSLRIIAYGYVFYAWAMVMMQAFNGAGDTMTPTKLNVLCFWMVQIPMAWLLSVQAGLGPPGVFWSVMGAESLLAVVSMVVFRRGYWKTRAV